jgi:signal transduction histidine kinase
MKIRWKLNLLVTTLIAVFLMTVAFVMYAGRLDERATLRYEGTVGLSQFTSDVRSSIYLHLAADAKASPLPPGLEAAEWPRYLLEDIAVRIRLSENETERRLWSAVHETITEIGRLQTEGVGRDALAIPVHRVVHDLRLLRNDYDRRSSELQAVMAENHFRSYAAVWTATILTICLMFIHLIMVRRWLVAPISRLMAWSDTTGTGVLDRPVALDGRDELADLARHMAVMAGRLAQHQKELLEARELSAIGEVCGNIAHGLRNPLASIRTSVQLAQRDAHVSEPLGKTLARLLAQADRMDERITRMFEFSRPLAPHRSPVTFAALAVLARTDAQPLLHDASVDLEILDETGDTTWLVDSSQIGCVLAELITNATHHSKPGASVTVSGTILPPSNGSSPVLCIQVIDRGAGMPPAMLDKVFDLFFTSRAEGTGVGLALADRIIRKHDGAIRIESTPGAGTTVTITLPGGTTPQSSPLFDASKTH